MREGKTAKMLYLCCARVKNTLRNEPNFNKKSLPYKRSFYSCGRRDSLRLSLRTGFSSLRSDTIELTSKIKKASRLREAFVRAGGETRTLTPCGTRS